MPATEGEKSRGFAEARVWVTGELTGEKLLWARVVRPRRSGARGARSAEHESEVRRREAADVREDGRQIARRLASHSASVAPYWSTAVVGIYRRRALEPLSETFGPFGARTGKAL